MPSDTVALRESYADPRTLCLFTSYLNLPDSRRTVIGIIGLNAVVFGLWRLGGLGVARGRLEAFMARNFLHSPASGRTYTMLTSTFSHRGGLHFLFNNIALWSM